jgi:hypothetical protein
METVATVKRKSLLLRPKPRSNCQSNRLAF